MFKAKKIVFVFVLVMLLILPVLSVNAATTDEPLGDNFVEIKGENTIYLKNNDNAYFYVDFMSFYVKRNNLYYEGGTVTSSRTDDGNVRLRLNIKSELGNLKPDDVVSIYIHLIPYNSVYKNPDYNVTGSFAFGMKWDASAMMNYSVTRSDGSYTQEAKRSVTRTEWGDYVKCSFNEKSFGRSFDEYSIGFDYLVYGYGSNYANYIYLQDFNFYYATQSEYSTDKQIQADKDLYEQEKSEIQESGDKATESTDDVPDQSEGFINAMGGLVSAMSYNGTECKWTLPKVEMPKVSNIIPKMTLIKQQEIDFGYWVEKMPTNILNLVRAVCTIALIVFCFKELYGTISYVFTLKGGGGE